MTMTITLSELYTYLAVAFDHNPALCYLLGTSALFFVAFLWEFSRKRVAYARVRQLEREIAFAISKGYGEARQEFDRERKATQRRVDEVYADGDRAGYDRGVVEGMEVGRRKAVANAKLAMVRFFREQADVIERGVQEQEQEQGGESAEHVAA